MDSMPSSPLLHRETGMLLSSSLLCSAPAAAPPRYNDSRLAESLYHHRHSSRISIKQEDEWLLPAVPPTPQEEQNEMDPSTLLARATEMEDDSWMIDESMRPQSLLPFPSLLPIKNDKTDDSLVGREGGLMSDIMPLSPSSMAEAAAIDEASVSSSASSSSTIGNRSRRKKVSPPSSHNKVVTKKTIASTNATKKQKAPVEKTAAPKKSSKTSASKKVSVTKKKPTAKKASIKKKTATPKKPSKAPSIKKKKKKKPTAKTSAVKKTSSPKQARVKNEKPPATSITPIPVLSDDHVSSNMPRLLLKQDVVLGRNACHHAHPGNLRYRRLIDEHRDVYQNTSGNGGMQPGSGRISAKQQVCLQVWQAVGQRKLVDNLDPDSANKKRVVKSDFVRQVVLSDSSATVGLKVGQSMVLPVPQSEALSKIGQALRELDWSLKRRVGDIQPRQPFFPGKCKTKKATAKHIAKAKTKSKSKTKPKPKKTKATGKRVAKPKRKVKRAKDDVKGGPKVVLKSRRFVPDSSTKSVTLLTPDPLILSLPNGPSRLVVVTFETAEAADDSSSSPVTDSNIKKRESVRRSRPDDPRPVSTPNFKNRESVSGNVNLLTPVPLPSGLPNGPSRLVVVTAEDVADDPPNPTDKMNIARSSPTPTTTSSHTRSTPSGSSVSSSSTRQSSTIIHTKEVKQLVTPFSSSSTPRVKMLGDNHDDDTTPVGVGISMASTNTRSRSLPPKKRKSHTMLPPSKLRGKQFLWHPATSTPDGSVSSRTRSGGVPSTSSRADTVPFILSSHRKRTPIPRGGGNWAETLNQPTPRTQSAAWALAAISTSHEDSDDASKPTDQLSSYQQSALSSPTVTTAIATPKQKGAADLHDCHHSLDTAHGLMTASPVPTPRRPFNDTHQQQHAPPLSTKKNLAQSFFECLLDGAPGYAEKKVPRSHQQDQKHLVAPTHLGNAMMIAEEAVEVTPQLQQHRVAEEAIKSADEEEQSIGDVSCLLCSVPGCTLDHAEQKKTSLLWQSHNKANHFASNVMTTTPTKAKVSHHRHFDHGLGITNNGEESYHHHLTASSSSSPSFASQQPLTGFVLPDVNPVDELEQTGIGADIYHSSPRHFFYCPTTSAFPASNMADNEIDFYGGSNEIPSPRRVSDASTVACSERRPYAEPRQPLPPHY